MFRTVFLLFTFTYVEAKVNSFLCANVTRNTVDYGVKTLQDVSREFRYSSKINGSLEAGRSNGPLIRLLRSNIKHGLIAAAVEAYNNHLGLELSPDDLWTAIAQGVAKHLNYKDNANTTRETLVNFDGKKNIEVFVDNYGINLSSLGGPATRNKTEKWERVVDEFSDRLRNLTKSDFADLMMTPFTTSSELESIVYKTVLMEAMSPYVNYWVIDMCGIPEVTLIGQTADYKDIRERVKRLSTVFPELDWWFPKVQSIVSKFIESMEGNPDLAWWNGIVVDKYAVCTSFPSGWLTDLFPYLEYNGALVRQDASYIARLMGGLNYENFPYGLTDVPLYIAYQHYNQRGTKHKLRLTSGFLGVSQNNITKNLKPALGWMLFYELLPQHPVVVG